MSAPETQTQVRGHPRPWLWRLSLFVLALLVLLYLLESFVAERWWVSTLLTYAPQHPILVPPALLLLLSLALRQWRAAALNTAALLLAVFFFLGVHVPLHRAPRPAAPPLRVMTFNLERFVRTTPAQLLALAEQEHVDVLCVQEANPVGSQQASPELLSVFGGWRRVAHDETVIFSRYPVSAPRVYQMGGSSRTAVAAEIAYHGTRFTVLDVHFSVALFPETLESHAGSLPSYLRRTAETRARQAASLLDIARRIHTPLVMMGDFNTPPRGLVYRRLTSRFRDGFAAAGWGTGYTYPARRPLLRIDYIFVTPEVAVYDCRVLPLRRLSDHRPLLAEVAVQ